jgi:lipid II:glycine glycyltransferase (peptidoglycan interpeptide bridge formation enzyme)
MIDLAGFGAAGAPESVPLFAEFSSARRQEVRYAIRDGVVTTREFDADAFVRFYGATMARQGLEVEAPALEGMRRLIEGSHGAGLGRMYVSRTAAGEPGSMAYMGLDARRAYYVFGANDPALRDSHTGTAVLWDAFRMLAGEGVAEVDLEGVNSPRRGWFKLSFGGTLVPYYELCLEQSR